MNVVYCISCGLFGKPRQQENSHGLISTIPKNQPLECYYRAHDEDYKIILESGDDAALDEKFKTMLNNLTKENPLIKYDRMQKIALLCAYNRVNHQVLATKYSDYINNLIKSGLDVKKSFDIIADLHKELKNDLLKWIKDFGENDIQQLVIKIEEFQAMGNEYVVVETECIKCIKTIMNHMMGIELIFSCNNALSALAKSLNIQRQLAMVEAVEILAGTCLIRGGYDKVLEAITLAGKTSGKFRFIPIVDAMRNGNELLNIACMQLVNAIICKQNDLIFRISLRHEFMKINIQSVIERWRGNEDHSMSKQVEVFDKWLDDDRKELSQKFKNEKNIDENV